MQLKTFGQKPGGKRLQKILNSPNYRDGSFQNLSVTEVMLKGASKTKMLGDFFRKPKDTTPLHELPSVKTNLHTLQHDAPVIVWFGHSSYFIKHNNFTVLVDPVFSGYASPVNFFGKAFKGTDIYTADDMPHIDMCIITHDHYDHLDYKTILQLKDKTTTFYTSLGVGSHLEYWGIDAEKIKEFDWWDTIVVTNDIKLTALPARHFSGRGFKRGETLWSSFALQLFGYNIYIGADSGYDTHFKTIGEKYGPFDIAILECGQYGANWPYIHMTPEQTVTAAIDLKAKALLPVHHSKFALAMHPWNEPLKRVVAAAENNITIATPIIGKPVIINKHYPSLQWWV